MDGYVAAKRRILLGQGKGDTAVIGVDDPWASRSAPRSPPPTAGPSAHQRAQRDRPGRLRPAGQALRRHRRAGDRGRRPDRAPGRCPGRHNWQNAAAAYAAARALGVSVADAAEGLISFPGPRASDGDGRRHRRRAFHQRLQGDQRRRRPPGHVELSAVLLDRRRPGQGRRHRQPRGPVRPRRPRPI